MKAEYYIHRPIKKFDHMSLVSRDQSLHQGSSQGMQKEVIDLSIPGQISPYDKSGYKRLFSVKLILFGDEHIRMTKERCEKFFEDDNNFEIDIITRQWLDSILALRDEAQKIIRW